MKRIKISKRLSRRIFKKTASKPHPKNIAPTPMRGGIRLALPFIVAALVALGVGCTGCKTTVKDITFGVGEALFETK